LKMRFFISLNHQLTAPELWPKTKLHPTSAK